MSNDNEFMTLCGQAFLSGETIFEIATALEISGDYARQLRDGKHKISAPIRAKLDTLIAAKGDGPVDQAIIDEADDSVEPSREQFEVDLQAAQPMPRRTKYQVIKVFDGYAVAEEYAHWLNDQINRGKEGG